jgi:hypothetical protein
MHSWVALVVSLVLLVSAIGFTIWAMNLPTPKEEERDAPEPDEDDWGDDDE